MDDDFHLVIRNGNDDGVVTNLNPIRASFPIILNAGILLRRSEVGEGASGMQGTPQQRSGINRSELMTGISEFGVVGQRPNFYRFQLEAIGDLMNQSMEG